MTNFYDHERWMEICSTPNSEQQILDEMAAMKRIGEDVERRIYQGAPVAAKDGLTENLAVLLTATIIPQSELAWTMRIACEYEQHHIVDQLLPHMTAETIQRIIDNEQLSSLDNSKIDYLIQVVSARKTRGVLEQETADQAGSMTSRVPKM